VTRPHIVYGGYVSDVHYLAFTGCLPSSRPCDPISVIFVSVLLPSVSVCDELVQFKVAVFICLHLKQKQTNRNVVNQGA